jgi:Cu/Ag efflux protein CusF
MVKMFVVASMISIAAPAAALAHSAADRPVILAQAAQSEAPKAGEAAKPGATRRPKVVDAAVVTVRGTVEAIDTEAKTVTLKGPKRSLTLPVRDPKKLETIKVGDPVVAKYYEALAIEVKKPGEATPGVSSQQAMATSKPGETPAGAVGQEVTATVTVVGIDKKAHTVTVKGPGGETDTVKARDPKNLEHVKVGDLVELTYTRALVIALDKVAKK